MIRIKNELEFQTWFKKNYKKLGFSKIIKANSKCFPDFIMLKDGKEIKIELEIKTSNFISHKHPIEKVDKVICINKDVDLGIPTMELNNFTIIGFNENSNYSIKSRILKLFGKEKIMTTTEIAKKMDAHWNSMEKHLLELALDGKIQRMKKQGVNLWLTK